MLLSAFSIMTRVLLAVFFLTEKALIVSKVLKETSLYSIMSFIDFSILVLYLTNTILLYSSLWSKANLYITSVLPIPGSPDITATLSLLSLSFIKDNSALRPMKPVMLSSLRLAFLISDTFSSPRR